MIRLPFCLLLIWHHAESTSYKDFKLLKVTPKTDGEVRVLRSLLNEGQYARNVHVLNPALGMMANRSSEIAVSPIAADSLVKGLNKEGIVAKLLLDNLQRLIDEEKERDFARGQAVFKRNDSFHSLRLDKYHSAYEIQNILLAAQKAYPGNAVTFRMGYSALGHSMLGIKLGKRNGLKKKAIYVDAGIHAREWIAPSTALYLIHMLLTNYGKQSDVTALLNELDWYIFPLVNPDGYEYSRLHDRLWRKSRSKSECNLWTCCRGVDLNRNFGFHWGENGASVNPCSDIYRGLEQFSEPETKAIRDFVMRRRDHIRVYFTLHSYSQYWLIPFGYHTPPRVPDNFDKMLRLAKHGVQAILDTHGRNYTLGNSATIFYSASGASDDWARGEANIPYAYTLELRPQDNELNQDENQNGFVLPSHQILPTGEEIYAGITTVAKFFLPKKYRKDNDDF